MTQNPVQSAFHPEEMAHRKQRYYTFLRSQRLTWFTPEATYRPETENDRRITFWTFPVFVSSNDPVEREWALTFYAKDPLWAEFNVFTSSSIAINLVREREYLTPDLILRSEEHLAQFGYADGGRKPSACVNDFTFQGYNDNMAAMATRQLILSGDILDRPELTDAGLFRLEGLCAHFQRRGMASEHTSGTYLPVTLTVLMDIAECTTHSAAREMSLACAQRILLDILCHFHQSTGSLGGSQSRAYTVDLLGSLSAMNSFLWYILGHPLLIDPIAALSSAPFESVLHHGGCKPFSAAAHAELFSPSYHLLSGEMIAFARTPHAEEHFVRATTDSGPFGLTTSAQAMSSVTTAYHRKLWCLASTMTSAPWSTQKTCLQGTAATTATPASWRDRLNFWEYVASGEDYGQLVANHMGDMAEIDHVNNIGEFRTLQKKGSALSSGLISPLQNGRQFTELRYGIIFGTKLCLPEEVFENNTRLESWTGETNPNTWQFLRFGQVFVGLRAIGTLGNDPATRGSLVHPRRIVRHNYLRLELPLIEDQKIVADERCRWRTHFGCVLEVSDLEECGSFEEFRRQCQAGTWEYYLTFARNSRYCGRNGEFYICDSPTDGTVRVMTIDGEVPEPPRLMEATGLDPKLVKLFPGGERRRLPRLLYNNDFPGTPFYSVEGLVLSTR